jgi:SAM-dependent methyltransferase
MTAALALAAPAAQPRSLAPYVPTPADVVDRMLALARAGPGDVVYDLGCGDGRIVIAAAQKFGARGVGVDIDEGLVARARAAAKAAGVEERVTFRVQDAMAVDVSEATIVTLYLLSASNVKLRPILTRQLRPGARIVAHNFPMGDWEPEIIDNFTDGAGTQRTLYLWTADGTVR